MTDKKRNLRNYSNITIDKGPLPMRPIKQRIASTVYIHESDEDILAFVERREQNYIESEEQTCFDSGIIICE
jgi:hypothetical protein